MKITRLAVESFRGFGRRQVFELADTNVLAGPNGFGKTSFFDAILWGLFGKVPRLSGTRDFISAGDILQNKFSTTPHSVELAIETPSGLVRIRRTSQQVICSLDAKKISHAQLLRVLRLENEEGIQRFLRSYLLQQETVNEFVRTINPRTRYDTLLSMLRFSLPALLTAQLEEASASASARQASVMRDLSLADGRASSLKVDVAKLEAAAKGASYEIVEQRYRAITLTMGDDLLHLLSFKEDKAGSLSIRERTIELENRMAEARRGLRNVRSQLDLTTQLETQSKEGFDQEGLRQEIAKLLEESKVLEESVTRGEAQLAAHTQSIRTLRSQIDAANKSQGEKRASLAAIRRVVDSDACPVCLRPIDRDLLLRIIDEQIGATGPTLSENLNNLDHQETQLKELRQRIEDQRAKQSKNADRVSQLRTSVANREKLDAVRKELRSNAFAKTWGIFSEDSEIFGRQTNLRIEQMNALEVEARELLSMIDKLSAAELLPTRMEELSSVTRECADLQASNTELALILSTLKRYLAAVSQSQIGLISDFVKLQGPLIRSLYQRMYPHPLFPEIDLEVTGAYGSGELYLAVSSSQKTTKANPSTIFSASQLNVLAVVVFIALNLRSESSASFLMLDDPIHSMDDLNVLGFCDVIRQLKVSRQIVLSTHSRDFYKLLLSKLRPSSSNEVVKGFWFSDWSELGPTVEEQIMTYVPNQIPMPELRNLDRLSGS
jgi:DNA repair exonuclease SbcCD ATPase subunit